MKKLLPILLLLLSFAAVAQNTLSSIPPVVSGTDTYTVTVTGFPVSGGNAAILNRMFFARFTNANTGASTLVVNSLAAAANIQKWDGSAWVAVEAGDIPAGSDLKIRWDGTRFQIQVQAGGGGSGGTIAPESGTGTATGTVTTDLASNDWDIINNDGHINISGTGDVNIDQGDEELHIGPTSGFIGQASTFTLRTPIATNRLTIEDDGSWNVGADGNGTAGQVLQSNGASAQPTWETPSGTGDVTGPGSSTDNAIVRFDGTTGKIIQNSTGNVITDAGLFQLGTLEAVASDTSIFYGTSITAGTNASVSTKRYAYLVAQGLQTIENNRGLGGYSLQKPLGYGGSSFMNVYNTGSGRIGIKTANAKFLFMAWGENDANNEFLGVSGFDTTQFKTDYLTVVNYAISKGWSTSNIIIISPFWFATTTTPLAIQQKYVRCARKFASDNGLKYIEDVFNTGASYGIYIQAGDGKHPTDYGMSLYGNVILQSMKAFVNVKNNSQKLAVNGAVSEFQEVLIRNLNQADDNAMLVARNTDGRLSVHAPERFVRMYSTDPGTGFRNTSNIFTDGLIRTSTVTESSTGSFFGASWAYSNTLLTSGINRTMIGVNGGFGYIWTFDGTTHRSIKIAELGGNLLVGTSTDVSAVKHQVTGRGYYTTGLYLGGAVSPTARLHIASETASSNTGPIKFTAPAARLTVNEAGVLGPEIGGDDLTFTIATGTVNKKLTLSDITLTPGRVSYNGTNGRQTDDPDFTFDGTKLSTGTLRVGTSSVAGQVLKASDGVGNLGYSNPTFTDDLFGLQDNTDATKQAAFQLSSITSGQTRTYTLQDATGTLAMLATNQIFSGGNLFTGTTGFSNTVSIADASDGTKIAQFQVDQVSSSTTRTFDFPDASGTFALFGGAIGVTEGANATMGTATLSAGTVTVNTNKVTANSRIFLTVNGGTLTNVGSTYISARSAGTSFTISSTNVLDASQVAWIIIEPQ